MCINIIYIILFLLILSFYLSTVSDYQLVKGSKKDFFIFLPFWKIGCNSLNISLLAVVR